MVNILKIIMDKSLGLHKIFAIRSSLILENSYVAGTEIKNTELYNQLIVYIDFTKGSIDSLQVKIELTSDGDDYYRETALSVSGGTSTMALNEYHTTSTGKYRIALPIKDASIKISVKGIGTVTNSLVKVVASLGTV